jgi:hypothetical protein
MNPQTDQPETTTVKHLMRGYTQHWPDCKALSGREACTCGFAELASAAYREAQVDELRAAFNEWTGTTALLPSNRLFVAIRAIIGGNADESVLTKMVDEKVRAVLGGKKPRRVVGGKSVNESALNRWEEAVRTSVQSDTAHIIQESAHEELQRIVAKHVKTT